MSETPGRDASVDASQSGWSRSRSPSPAGAAVAVERAALTDAWLMLTNHSCCADSGPGRFAAAEVTSGDWQWPARRAKVSPDLVLQCLRVKA